jgi:hypothetical protein
VLGLSKRKNAEATVAATAEKLQKQGVARARKEQREMLKREATAEKRTTRALLK